MEDNLIWLIFIAFAVVVFTFIQQKDNRYQRLKKDHQRLEMMYNTIQEEHRKAEFDKGQLERNLTRIRRWKDHLHEIKSELKEAKRGSDYLSAKRLDYLEKFITSCMQSDSPDFIFLETFETRTIYTFKDRLNRMLGNAEFEIEIVSPWIKRSTWDSIKAPLARFAEKGGALKVFTRGNDTDITRGLSDDIRNDVMVMGGEVILIKHLHAKLYLVDRKEAILASANLTRGGIQGNLEAGIWSNNPVLLRDICKFIDNLYLEGVR
jgi:hypothetical protein